MSDPVLVLREALDKATEGPWAVDAGRWFPPGWEPGMGYLRVVAGEPNPTSGIRKPVVHTDGAMEGHREDVQHYRDAHLIVAARNLLPVLLDEVEALRKVVDGVKALPGVWKREASRLIERAERCSLEDFIRSERLIERATALADAAGATARLLAVLDKEEEK